MEIAENSDDSERIKAMVLIRDSVHGLLELQINNSNGVYETEIADAQKALSEKYDRFVEQYGRIGQAEKKKHFLPITVII